ncbi:MAG: LLM class flavin-dependent oxidoreductase [Caldilineaceae bacterium]|nr:LLM class flavin-dependent oxidoreductase [Caldilineaceae bacterium]
MTHLGTPTGSPRLGLFLQVDRAPDVKSTYAEVLELIVAAEQLGYHSARVTQHHFGERYGRLPAPLPFLVAAAERTQRIRLGTVVITITLEQPLRLAEDAAVTDLLMDGRLELGLGSGFAADVFAAFGVDLEQRRALTTTGFTALRRILAGEPLDDRGTQLQPPDPDLLNRLWLAVMSQEGAAYAAQHQMGLLLGRVERGGGSPVANQALTVNAYRAALGAQVNAARIAVGRAVYPANDRASAKRDLAEALAQSTREHVKRGLLTADASLDEILTRFHILHGHPEEIGMALAAEQAALGWSELLVQIDPGDMPHAKALRALERVAREVAPYLATPALAVA